MSKLKTIMVLGLIALTGCEQAAPFQVAPGETLREFTITRSNAFGVTPIPQSAINARAAELCPQGYRILEQYGEANRRISGIVYTDVDVTLACK